MVSGFGRQFCPDFTYSHATSLCCPTPKPIPEHSMALISKNTTRNKACQTHRAYDPYWPETHMNISFCHTNACMLTTTQTNDKTTKAVQTNNIHNRNTPVLHSNDAKPVSNVFSVQALSAKTNKMRLPNPDPMVVELLLTWLSPGRRRP